MTTLTHIPAGSGTTWIIGGTLTCKVTGSATNDAYSLFELTLAKDEGSPWHQHQREAELFYILAGTLTVEQAGTLTDAPAGSTIILPQGSPHRFYNRADAPCHCLIFAIPGGLDRYFAGFDELQKRPNARQADLDALNAQYGISFVTPEQTHD